ncbi:MAG: PAS domain S-box protein, partial [Gammaproteobacteria bacterium]|nr:PAS domain S-box protein [Gammaproteobacteria bacterium]
MFSERYIKSKVGAAFGLVIALMIAIVLINAAYLNNSSEHLGRVVGVHNTQMLMMNQMLDLSRRRSLTLQHMLMDDDKAHLDDQLRKMDVINSEYVNLRDKLHDLTYTLEEIDLLKKQSALTMNTGVIQGRVIEMLVEGDSAGAIKLFHEQAIPSVSSSMELMNEFVALQSKHGSLEMKANRDGVMIEIKLSLFLLGIGFLLSIFIALWVVARLRSENERYNQIEEELEQRVAEQSREVVALSVQSTETRMQTLFDISPEFIFIIDTEGVVIKTNQYACDNSGYSMDEIVGKWIWDFFTEDSKMVCDCNFPKLRKSGNSRADIEFVCKDQRVINMECTAIVVPDQNGDLKNFMMMQRDVTQSRKSASALVESEK